MTLDAMGPEAAKSWPGKRLVVVAPTAAEPALRPAGRARQEIAYGRREKGYSFGAFQPATGVAFQPATGVAFTALDSGRTIANGVDFLEQVDAWLPAEVARVYAILDNRSTHRAVAVLRFTLTHPRGEFVFQPVYAAYLNLIEPWWKVLRSLALKGRRFESWRRSARPSKPRRPTGMRTSIPSSGAVDGDIVRAGKPALDWCPQLPELGGCTT
ncbi:MAG: transposase [Ktedonobacterales bacterium]